MKTGLILFVAALFLTIEGYSQEFKIVTVVESIVPMGLGRSRIVDSKSEIDITELTTERSAESQNSQRNVRRRDARVDNFEEIKLLNFYSAVGINFQNIASNDAIIGEKINSLLSEGWELKFVTSAVESDAGKDDGNGIFITRLFFYREIPEIE